MPEKVDIYAELLGLPPGARPPDYYALLGITSAEVDSQRIHDAARRRIAQLSAHLTGPQAQNVQQLMSEIATARAVLTTPQGRERYDRKLRQLAGSAPATVLPNARCDEVLPPRAVDALSQAQTVGETAFDAATPRDLLPAPAAGFPRWSRPVEAPPQPPEVSSAAPPVPLPRLVAGPGAMFTPSNSAPPAPLPIPELPPLAVEPAVLADAWSLPPPAVSASSFHAHPPQARAATYRPRARERERTQMALLLVLACLLAVVILGIGGLLVWRQNAPAIDRPEIASTHAGQVKPPLDRDADTSRKSPRAETAARERTQPLGNDRERIVTTRPATRDERLPQQPLAPEMSNSREARSASDMNVKKDAPKAMAADAPAGQSLAIREALTAARDALAVGNLQKVDELIDQAMFDASTDDLRAQVEGVRTLRAYVGSFWNAVRESLKTVNSGTEIEIEGDVVIVVEISRDRDNLVVRMRGANRKFDVQQLPPDLAVGLAERWLDKDDVNSRAFVGTYLATSGRRDDVQRGRRILEEAKSKGSEVARAVLEHLAP